MRPSSFHSLSVAAIALLALTSAACVRETVSCADNPSPVCPDAGRSGMDAGPRPDAFTPDVSGDAPGLDVNLPDVYEPDAPLPDDAWAPDAGNDGGPCSRCPSATPGCFEDGCVECTEDAHCAGHVNGPACDTSSHLCVGCTDPALHCTGGLAACVGNTCVRCDGREDCAAPTPACIGFSCVQCESRSDCSAPSPACFGNACVQCDTNTDCGTPSASRCDVGAHACAACMGDADCGHIGGNPRCVAGTCRACTVATEAMDCVTPATSCNPATYVCGARARGTVPVCNRCDADSECTSGNTCAAVNPALGTSGNFCLPIRTSACSAVRPYAEGVNGDTTDLGTLVNYCRPATTTCEAVLHHRTAQPPAGSPLTPRCTTEVPAGTSDDACGATSVSDAVCRTSTGGDNLCTYVCAADLDCRTGTTCVDLVGDGTSTTFCSI